MADAHNHTTHTSKTHPESEPYPDAIVEPVASPHQGDPAAPQDGELTDAAEPSLAAAPNAEPDQPAQPQRYVRPRSPHKTMGAVNDLEQDDAMGKSLRDSNFTLRSRNPFVGRSYKRSRNEMPQLQHDLHYGQYLTMPKGGKPIFASRERKRRLRSALAMVAIIAILAIIVLIIVRLSTAAQ